jgi:hypothetical protein
LTGSGGAVTVAATRDIGWQPFSWSEIRVTVIPELLHRSFALLLTIVLVLTLAPVRSLAEADPATPIGSLLTGGSVLLRGVPLSREGTLFSGDTIHTDEEAYARLSLLDGQRIELGPSTHIDVARNETHVEIAMHTGALAFAAPASSNEIRVEIPSYQIVALQGSSGDITLLDSGEVGVRPLEGSILVQADGALIEIPEGERQILQVVGPQGPPAPEDAALGTVADTIIWTSVVGLVVGIVAYQLLTGGDPASPSTPE